MSKTIDLAKFKTILPKELLDFSELLLNWGYVLTLVGGAVRDFALYGSLSKDLDFEVRSVVEVDSANWEEKFKSLGLKIEQLPSAKVEVLRFNIMRVQLNTLDLEISSPRIEIYDDRKDTFGHSDFSVKFSSNYSYEESFARRDFSLNALGIELGRDFKFIDPFNGMNSIESKELDYITSDFFKDPVRFLRTLRFKVAHNLSLSRRLKDDLVYFNLEKLSLHYFKQEGSKIGLEKLLYEMDFARRKFAVKLPEWASTFDEVAIFKLSPCNELIDLVMNYSIQEGASIETLKKLGQSFTVKQTLLKTIISLKGLYKIDLKKFKKEILKNGFEHSILDERFLAISRLHKEKNKIPEGVLNFYLSKDLLELLDREIEKDSLYQKTLPTISKPQISMLGIYCHIIKNI